MLRPCPRGKVKPKEDRGVITIGQLARYAGVSTKTIRVYHDKGLLPEPDRDASGYRRYTAQDAIDLLKIRVLVEAGVPLARIRELLAATNEEFRSAIDGLDADLTRRIRDLGEAQDRLRGLASGPDKLVPARVAQHVEQLRDIGLSQRWIDLVTDLWILSFATHPDTAAELIRDQGQALEDPLLRQIFLDYDRAYDLDPNDPAVDDLARRIVEATRQRYGGGDLPGSQIGSEVPALIQAAVNKSSPAWEQIDTLVRDQLERAASGPTTTATPGGPS
jgi:DNA-binding transcriptional MerR regulator